MASLVEVFIDGASRYNGTGKATEAACACVVYQGRKEIASFARLLGPRTNNAAEYEALINALLICSNTDFPHPIIYSDSLVVVNQTLGTWRCASQDLFPYYLTVQAIRKDYPFQILHVPRAKVYKADALCNEALDKLEEERQKLVLSRRSGES